MDTSPHKSDFVHVNGINLHYLDWGGNGEALIFLTGMGGSAHLFDRFAPRFADRFHVLALTRRGQGESDAPESGYDLDTLVDDIVGFMDRLRIEKAILSGHSLAGIELTYLAQKYPERVIKLVYLDAVYDGTGRATHIEEDPLESIPPPEFKKEFTSLEEAVEYFKYIRPALAQVWSEPWDTSVHLGLVKHDDGKYRRRDRSFVGEQLFETMAGFHPRDINVHVPVLSFVAIFEMPTPAYFTEAEKKAATDFNTEVWLPFQEMEVQQFKQDMPHANVIELSNSHHYCFMWQEDLVLDEMRKFLLE